ncbi:hypothetical protein COEREDRAFT_41061 [Coemansia reversa NRRL 1564]|uniref:DUF3421 domain-containing protein n=1 Tax=Coemansia reversa (strain ATCC 12441 / NRRL 1564) TaxID=763665 RepID=A0A2G5BDV4_COERN|nr:hypothetical protein COEREDRAFT_41061 [Coemansia reversa NRRL 1564]|eukprot:PIA17200.1 hypothetical protein COEREDRAFT_41061 [Coemansia reversa NRRL 1564]
MQQFQWVKQQNGAIPLHGISQGGESDGRPLFIAYGEFKGGLHPGKAGPHLKDGGFALGWGGRAQRLNEYYVLCGDINRAKWINVNGPAKLDESERPVEAGREQNGQPLYIARATVGNSLQLGKAAPHLTSGMSFAFGDGERNEKNYQVLVYK